MKSPNRQIESSAIKSTCDSKASPIDFFQTAKSNAKTPFFTTAKSITQRPTTQQPPHIKAFKHDAMADTINNSVRRYATSPLGLTVAVTDPAEFRQYEEDYPGIILYGFKIF